MATLRFKFPEKNEPTTLALSGSRVTLGRLPLNTIQIIDRTLSGFHAEFVLEDDHYRLHDRGSTNGTFVNGETVTDFHLREACKISFGGLDCEYSPEAPAPADSANVEALPTRSEINAVRQENVELKARIDALRGEIETLNKTRGPETGSGTIAVAKDEYDKVLAERDFLKETQRTTGQEIERLKADLAQLQRDRESLKKVADDAKAEIATLIPEPPAPPAAAPEPVAPVGAKPEPPPPAAAASPEPPLVTPPPPVAPKELPKPSFSLPTARPAPKPPGSLPGVPVKLPVAAPAAFSAGPVARPSAGPASAAPTATPGLRPIPRPLPNAPISQMKGGTQKIDSETTVKPVVPTVRVTPKPPLKLPIQPTVRLQPGQKPSLPSNDQSAT